MEPSKRKIGAMALLLVATVVSSGLLAQVSNAQTICNVSFSSLMTCKPAVTRPNPTPPSSACCSAISHANLNCLCSYKESSILPSLGIDPILAAQLPGKCRIPNAPKC